MFASMTPELTASGLVARETVVVAAVGVARVKNAATFGSVTVAGAAAGKEVDFVIVVAVVVAAVAGK